MPKALQPHPDRALPAGEAREVARRIHESTKDLPLLCFHGHVDVALFATDEAFGNPAEVKMNAADLGTTGRCSPNACSPNQIRNKENRGLRVFTPFWRRVQALGDPPKPLPAPTHIPTVR